MNARKNIILVFLSIYYLTTWTTAQQLSTITTAHETQATGSSALFTISASSSNNVTDMWAFIWYINQNPVALVAIFPNSTSQSSTIESDYTNRTVIRTFLDRTTKLHYNITSEMTLLNLKKNENGIKIKVYSHKLPIQPQPVTLNVSDCPSQIGNSLEVVSENYTFNQPGQFACCNSGTLFNSNGTKLQSSKTFCQASTIWLNTESVQCWYAPEVTIKGNRTVNEGSYLNLTCEYDEVFPTGKLSGIFVDGLLQSMMPKNLSFSLGPMGSSFDGKEVYCQAITPYTQTLNNTGRSPTSVINVLYAPFLESSEPCTWKPNTTAWCNVTIRSNPVSCFVKLIKNGGLLQNNTKSVFTLNEDEVQWNKTNHRQTFSYKVSKVSSMDTGKYFLILSSSFPPYNHTIILHVVVANASATSTFNDIGLLLGVILAVVVLFISVGLISYIYKKKRHQLFNIIDAPARSSYSQLNDNNVRL